MVKMNARLALSGFLMASLLFSANAQDKGTSFKEGEKYDYKTVMAAAKEVVVKADTSTSTVVNWDKSPQIKVQDVSEDKVTYKTVKKTDGYKKGEKMDLIMDILSDGDTSTKKPLVVFIPGGGFVQLDPVNSRKAERTWWVKNGYVVASVQYRLVGEGYAMDALNDILDAVAWLKKNAAKYGIDPKRIAIVGNSAGGYFTALTACYKGKDFKCAIDMYGLSDLTKVGEDYDDDCKAKHLSQYSSEAQFVNGVFSNKTILDDPKAAAKANPVTYIDGNEPPFLFLHGDNDPLVSPSQTLIVHEALLAKGEESTRYVLEGAGHGTPAFSTEEALKTMTDFLDKYCK